MPSATAFGASVDYADRRWQIWRTRADGEVTLLAQDPEARPTFRRVSWDSVTPCSTPAVGPSRAEEMLQRFHQQSRAAESDNARHLKKVEVRWLREGPPSELTASAPGSRVGYVVATLCPMTRGHLAMAQAAVQDLDLDAVYFMVWPFTYIRGFHSSPLEPWAARQQHLDWPLRMQIARRSIADFGDTRIRLLEAAQDWYGESSRMYSRKDPSSVYWTGTWYVTRKLKFWLERVTPGPFAHYAVCGTEQLARDVAVLVEGTADRLAWSTYSIAHHLTLHSVYASPRPIQREGVEAFAPPEGAANDVIFGSETPMSRMCATDVRFGTMPPAPLDELVMPGAAALIRGNGWWGYN
ncbi:hypothetical protein GCM10009839_01000 [Catenulispora yoronensis]|uniref:Cytidyltransferase-like domain-containing protein n=2 Tax=Catenulispora yoronensis TaxID=450799 RepID=A0ABN2TIJ3_9ACTN